MTEPRPLPLGVGGTKSSTLYHEFECSVCGKTDSNTYCEPHRTDMLTRRLCFTCNYWKDFEAHSNLSRMTIINSHIYTPGNRTDGDFRGMAGRRFDIEYLPSSVFAGQRCTTFDLWSGSTIPERLREKFPDTARFLGGAEKTEAGGIGCWNPSDRKSDPFPLPRELKEMKL